MFKKEVKDNVFSEYTYQSCYWAGLLAADGNIDINGTIGLELKEEDSYLIEEFKSFCESSHDISFNIIKKSKRIRFVSSEMQNDLLFNFAITTDKTHKLEVPLFNELWQYKQYYKGFFDGDGCFSEFFNNRPLASYRVFLTNGSELFLTDTLNLLREFKIIKTGSIQKKAINCWHIQLAVGDSTSFLNWIYEDNKPPFMTRKYLKYKNIIVDGNRSRK